MSTHQSPRWQELEQIEDGFTPTSNPDIIRAHNRYREIVHQYFYHKRIAPMKILNILNEAMDEYSQNEHGWAIAISSHDEGLFAAYGKKPCPTSVPTLLAQIRSSMLEGSSHEHEVLGSLGLMHDSSCKQCPALTFEEMTGANLDVARSPDLESLSDEELKNGSGNQPASTDNVDNDHQTPSQPAGADTHAQLTSEQQPLQLADNASLHPELPLSPATQDSSDTVNSSLCNADIHQAFLHAPSADQHVQVVLEQGTLQFADTEPRELEMRSASAGQGSGGSVSAPINVRDAIPSPRTPKKTTRKKNLCDVDLSREPYRIKTSGARFKRRTKRKSSTPSAAARAIARNALKESRDITNHHPFEEVKSGTQDLVLIPPTNDDNQVESHGDYIPTNRRAGCRLDFEILVAREAIVKQILNDEPIMATDKGLMCHQILDAIANGEPVEKLSGTNLPAFGTSPTGTPSQLLTDGELQAENLNQMDVIMTDELSLCASEELPLVSQCQGSPIDAGGDLTIGDVDDQHKWLKARNTQAFAELMKELYPVNVDQGRDGVGSAGQNNHDLGRSSHGNETEGVRRTPKKVRFDLGEVAQEEPLGHVSPYEYNGISARAIDEVDHPHNMNNILGSQAVHADGLNATNVGNIHIERAGEEIGAPKHPAVGLIIAGDQTKADIPVAKRVPFSLGEGGSKANNFERIMPHEFNARLENPFNFGNVSLGSAHNGGASLAQVVGSAVENSASHPVNLGYQEGFVDLVDIGREKAYRIALSHFKPGL